nr:hypothetical protein B0A51_14034 [Rachicladosporium sp. CCFEE 5018]
MSYESTVIITGGTTGLGYECARTIAKQKPESRIIIAARSAGNEAVANINKETGLTNVQYSRLDLSDLTNVRSFADKITTGDFEPISALVLNAGIQISGDITFTKQEIETTFGVNHVGHALLLLLLMPKLESNARIVITSSGTHDLKQKSGLPDAIYKRAQLLAHPNEESTKYVGQQRYATSKLCNVLWTYAMERRRAADPAKHSWTINAMDPGLMPGTGLARDYGAVLWFIWRQILPRMLPILRLLLFSNIHTTGESGRNLARLAISADVQGVSGKYFKGEHPIASSDDSYDTVKQDELWSWTLEYLSRDAAKKQKLESLV